MVTVMVGQLEQKGFARCQYLRKAEKQIVRERMYDRDNFLGKYNLLK